MKPFIKILSFAYKYKYLALFNALLNILSVLFHLISIALVIPVLGILFGTQKKVFDAPTGNISKEWVEDYLTYKLTNIIESVGKADALGIICIAIVISFLLKNL